jgi:hypothetical protein
MRRHLHTVTAAVLLLLLAFAASSVNATGAHFGRRRRGSDGEGSPIGGRAFATSFSAPPPAGAFSQDGGHQGRHADSFSAFSAGDIPIPMSPQEIQGRMSYDGEFNPADLARHMPRQEGAAHDLGDHTEQHPGAAGWIPTGRFRKDQERRGDKPKEKPSAAEQPRYASGPRDRPDAYDFMNFGNRGGPSGGLPGGMMDPDFDAIGMDEHYTGYGKRPSKARKSKREASRTVSTENKQRTSGDGRPQMDVDPGECMMQASRVCNLRVMHINFARFLECIVDRRESLEGSCVGWAEHHAMCVPDMIKHCHKMPPPETTKCLIEKKALLDTMCSKSPIYDAMTEGFGEMDSKMAEAQRMFAAAAAGEAEAFERTFGPNDGDLSDEEVIRREEAAAARVPSEPILGEPVEADEF